MHVRANSPGSTPTLLGDQSLPVRLEPAVSARADDDVLVQSIRESSVSLSSESYQEFVDQVMCEGTFYKDTETKRRKRLLTS